MSWPASFPYCQAPPSQQLGHSRSGQLPVRYPCPHVFAIRVNILTSPLDFRLQRNGHGHLVNCRSCQGQLQPTPGKLQDSRTGPRPSPYLLHRLQPVWRKVQVRHRPRWWPMCSQRAVELWHLYQLSDEGVEVSARTKLGGRWDWMTVGGGWCAIGSGELKWPTLSFLYTRALDRYRVI